MKKIKKDILPKIENLGKILANATGWYFIIYNPGCVCHEFRIKCSINLLRFDPL